MNIKRFWIIISIIIGAILLLGGFLWFKNYQKNQTEIRNRLAITETAESFSLAWYNYNKQTDKTYLAKIKPYMTGDFFAATKYINTERPQDFQGQLPMSATVSGVEILEITDYEASSRVIILTKENSVENQITNTLTLIKTNGTWQVSSLK